PAYREPVPPRRRDEPTSYRDEPPPAYRQEPPGYRAPAQRERDPAAYREEPTSYRPPTSPGYRDQARPGYREPAPPSYGEPAAPSYREPAPPSYREPAPPTGREPAAPSYREPTAPGYRQPGPPAGRDRSPYPEQRTPRTDEPTRYRARAAAYRDEQPTTVFDRPTYRDGGTGATGGPAAAYRAGGPSYPDMTSRRPTAPPPGQRRATTYDVDEDDEVDEEPIPGGYLASALYTVMWFAVPMVLWVLWSLTLSGQASANCVDDAGAPCASERVEALTTLTDNLPRMLGTLAFSLVIAMVLRWVSSSWKAATVGFAAAVVGGGLATVGISVITGQPIG
ncbi:MAG TPA: hypothetical protein VFT95_08445, partial [Micromonosporaceae bacterium]|nr:hypothetical protein [Micromonosporaceae bacterium]